jgi:hypothetical protein
MVIDRGNFVSLLESQPEIALKLIGVLCTRLRHTSEQVEDILFGDLSDELLSSCCGSPGVLSLRYRVQTVGS